MVVDDAAPARQVVAITAANPSRPATLQIAPETDTRVLTIGRPFWTSRYSPLDTFDATLGPTFDIRLGDAAGRWAVNDVGVGPATVTKAPSSFNFSDNAAFYDEKGKRLTLPVSVPASGRTIRLQLGGLTAGDYNATIPFFGANAGVEPRKFMLIVQLIHDARTAAGMTQRQLADLIGTKQSVIARLEDADYEGHSLTMLSRIAEALHQRLEVRFVAARERGVEAR